MSSSASTFPQPAPPVCILMKSSGRGGGGGGHRGSDSPSSSSNSSRSSCSGASNTSRKSAASGPRSSSSSTNSSNTGRVGQQSDGEQHVGIGSIRGTSEENICRTSNRNLLEFVCIVITCLLCYANSARCGLVFDDISAVRDNKDLREYTPWRNIFFNDFWGTPLRKEHSHKSYRPFTVLTFRLNYLWHGAAPFGYHVVNMLLHVVVCVLWRRVCRLLLAQCSSNDAGAMTGNKVSLGLLHRCSFLATLLFAIHPIHTEAVTGVVGRAELLSSIFYLAAFLSYASAVTVGGGRSSSSHTRTRLTFAGSQLNVAPQRWQSSWTRWSTLTGTFIGCLLASMLSKEQGITMAGICATYELFVVQRIRPLELWHVVQRWFDETEKITLTGSGGGSSPKPVIRKNSARSAAALFCGSHVKRLAFLGAVTVALLLGRVYVMGSQLPVFTRFDNPASAAETPTRQLTYAYLIYLNVWLLLFPCHLCCDWTMGTIPLLKDISDSRHLLTLLTFSGLIALGMRACTTSNRVQSRTLLMCLAWTVLPFVPASNLFFPVGFVVAERILYMPSMGFCLLVAYGYSQLEQQWQSNRIMSVVVKAGMALLLLTHASKTVQRNIDWRDEYSLFMSGVHVNERNAKLFNNVGHALENEERYDEALVYFQQAVNIQEDDIGAHINVGRTYNNLKMYAEAEQAYRHAKALFPRIKPGESYQARIAPNHLNVFINLANLIAKNQTRLEEADMLYRQAISMRADYVQAYINRGDILMKLNRTAQAQEVYEKALLYDSENADIYYNLGVVFLEQGKSAQANVYFNKALELFPEHEQALLNSAILLQEIGGEDARQKSRDRLLKVLLKDADNEKVYFNLGMLAMDEHNFDEAEQYFKRAIHLKAEFRSALFNLALLLADAERPLDAVPYLNQLIRHHPDHIKGLILLGDIYINHMKDLDAAEICYRRILECDPLNIQGLHNLCVVFVERKLLAKAGACLRYAHYLAPSEDYILRHLEIVQTRLNKIARLPETAVDRQSAYAEYDPQEFPLPATMQEGSGATRQRQRS